MIEKTCGARYNARVMTNENKQLKYGAFISYIAILINTLTALIYLPWMARQLGQSGYGLYTLAFSFVNFFLVDFGLSAAVARFVAKYRAEHEEEKANVLVGTVTKLYLLIDALSIVVMVVVYFMIDRIYKGLTPQEIATFKPLYIIMTVYSMLAFPFMSLNGILTAYEKFVQLKLTDLFQKLFTVGLIILALTKGYGVEYLILANVAGGILCIIAKLYIVYHDTPIRPRFHVNDPEILKGVLSFSVWTAIVSICQRFIFNLAPTILGIVSNSREIALFSPANSLEGYFYLFAAAVNGLFLARVSRYVANNQESELFQLMVRVGRYQLAVMGLLFIGFICIGEDFMRVWMGEQYTSAAMCAVLMFIPDLLLFTQEIANDMVIAKNEVRHYAFSNIGMALICVLLSFPLSGRFGALGSCIAIAASYMFTFIYMNIVYKKRLNLDIFQFFRKCYVSFIIPYIITLLLSRFIVKQIPLFGWKGIGVKALVITVIYAAAVWLMALNPEEKQFFKRLFRRS